MRNIGLSLVAVFAIAVALLFLTSTLVVKDFTETVSFEIKDQVSMSIYFKDGVDEETVLVIQEEIMELSDVRDVQYISKQSALEGFINRHKDNAVLMAALAEVGNPFLPSLSIVSETSEGYETVIAFLEESPSRVFFEKIDYDQRKTIIDSIFNVTETVQKTGFILAIIMGFVSVLVVFNIVRLAIYGMKEEISIMRLVGVSRRYIASSFVFQGIITGIAGALVSLLIILAVTLIFGEKIVGTIPGLNLQTYFIANAGSLLLIQFGTAIVLGVTSSLVAIAKYLKI